MASRLSLPCCLACCLVLSISVLSSWSFTNSKTLPFSFPSIYFFPFPLFFLQVFAFEFFLSFSPLHHYHRLFFVSFFFRRSLILATVDAASLSTVPVKAETDNNKSVVPKSITRRHHHQTNFPRQSAPQTTQHYRTFLPSPLHITSAYTIPCPWLGKWGVNQREKTHAVTMGAPLWLFAVNIKQTYPGQLANIAGEEMQLLRLCPFFLCR